ncbi:bactofilin family protein [Natronorubrum thiooxidans]|uniref:Polymer-forming protein n=1 Tax=Natronorubrum thiooxidans TaxID=308853 RepID=A0A1N7H7P2_9EURY|nr:polymer-forming cytoskeletal protein [Natronorubrum thiooxidans]SIS20879.1 hypothetical protein SAMN05421752_1304 [Natronorubrum thiooxidans]
MAQIETTRAVVEANETYDGKIIPTEQAEIDRPVRVRDGSTVQGSIYGETVEIHSDAVVEGSVMGSGSVEVTDSRVTGEIGTPGRVFAETARVEGTITGKRIRLTDCVVRGNVVGMNVILENCVVLGITTADRELTIENSLCYTVRSSGDTILEDTTLILPQAIVNGTLDLETPVTVAGLGHIQVDQDGDNRSEDDNPPLPTMTKDDRYEREGTTYLTLAPRVLNLEQVTDRLDELENAIVATVDDTSGDEGATMSVEDVLSLLEADVGTPGPLE